MGREIFGRVRGVLLVPDSLDGGIRMTVAERRWLLLSGLQYTEYCTNLRCLALGAYCTDRIVATAAWLGMTITELLDYAMCWHAQYIERIVPGRPIDGGYDEEVRQVRVRTEGCQVCLSDATRVTGLLLRIVKAVTDWGFSAAYGCYFGNNRIRS